MQASELAKKKTKTQFILKSDIQQVITQGESESNEFKTSFIDEVIVSLVAFANSKGNTVYIGVSDKGEIKDVEIGKEAMQNWINEIKGLNLLRGIYGFTDQQLSERQNMLMLIELFPKLTREEKAQILGLSLSTVEKDLRRMRNLNLVGRKGSDRTGTWRIIKQNETNGSKLTNK